MSEECEKCNEQVLECTCLPKRIELFYTDLSVRTVNILRQHGIKYIDELVKLSTKEMLGWENLGKKTLNDIRSFLAEHNLALKDETINPNIQNMILKDLPVVLKGIGKQVDEAIKDLRYFRLMLDRIAETAIKIEKKINK